MKLPCEMMEDLLPLYAEDMATPATRAAVEEHLTDCESCREKLTVMRREAPEGPKGMMLVTVRWELRRRKLFAVIAAVCAAVALLLTMVSWEMRFLPLPYSPDAVAVEALADGRMSVTVYGANGINSWGSMDEDGRVDELYLEPYRLWRTDRGATATTFVDADVTVWFVDQTQGGELTRLLGEGSPEDGSGGQVMPRLVLGYYLLIAGGVAALALAGWFLLRRVRAGRVMKHLALLALCYIAAHGLVMGMATSSFDVVRDLAFILLLTPCLWGLVVSGMQILRQMRRDRA